MESIAYGIRHIVERLNEHNFSPNEIVVSGGATNSEFFMQVYADVTGLRLHTTAEPEASLLGSAVAAAYGAKLYPDLATASRSMVTYDRVYEPNRTNHNAYEPYYHQYLRTYPALKQLMHEMGALHQLKTETNEIEV